MTRSRSHPDRPRRLVRSAAAVVSALGCVVLGTVAVPASAAPPPGRLAGDGWALSTTDTSKNYSPTFVGNGYLAARVPALETLKQTGSWAGYYELNLWDYNGFIGAHPACANLVMATGFSGHGMQHSPATGRGVAELVAHGGFRTLDLSPLATARLAEGRKVIELGIV